MVAGGGQVGRWHRGAERLIEEGVDVISAGFPCQDISFAGEGAGLTGSRSGLVWNLLRTIRLVRPRRAVLENVAALLSRGLDQICGHLATVGYDTEWHCIPASAVGAPHQRDRIWIIASDAGGEQYESDCSPISGEIAAELSLATANAASIGCGSWREGRFDPGGARQLQSSLQEIADAGREPSQISPARRQPAIEVAERDSWWAIEPAVGRVAYGVPDRLDRLKSLGNSVVPQIPEIIGRAIMKASAGRTELQKDATP